MKRTYIPNEYNGEAWVLIDVLGVVTKGYGNCKLPHVEYCSWICDIIWYILFLFWVGRWYLLSTCVCTDPYLYVSSFVICGVQQTYRRLQLNRHSSQFSSRQISGWAIVPSSDWILHHSCLDVLEVWTWTISFTYFSFLNTLRIWNLRINVLGVMTSRF